MKALIDKVNLFNIFVSFISAMLVNTNDERYNIVRKFLAVSIHVCTLFGK